MLEPSSTSIAVDPARQRQAGIPERYFAARAADFPPEVRDALREGWHHHGGYFITGPTGTGKTHLTCAILNRLMETGHATVGEKFWVDGLWRLTPLFLVVPEMLATAQGLFSFGTATESYLTAIQSQPVLALDDFGSEKLTDWSLAVLDRIINHRVNRELFTIVTSNLTLPEVHALEPRVASRLGGLRVIVLAGDDRRLLSE